MYVYVTKFEGKPNLLKIGKSISPSIRNETLTKSHGKIVSSDHYQLGAGYATIEKYLHKKYSKYREHVCGDGGSEFFSESIYKDVTDYLNKYITDGYQVMDVDFIAAQLRIERKKYHDLIGKLLGYKYSSLHTGDWHSPYTGVWDIIKIESCISLGFHPEEVYGRFITTLMRGDMATRFTTPARLALAYKLSQEGTEKEKALSQLLDVATENNKNHITGA